MRESAASVAKFSARSGEEREMSRIGKQPIEITGGAKISIEKSVAVVSGPKGTLEHRILDGLELEQDGGVVTVKRKNEEGRTRSMHGLMRTLLANAVEGVTKGFSKQLDVIGVGYRAEVKGKELHMSLGFSHPVVYSLPEGINAETDKSNRITISGYDKQQVGQVAAEIRSLRPPEPYKGKGVRYVDEHVRRKVGKAGGK